MEFNLIILSGIVLIEILALALLLLLLKKKSSFQGKESSENFLTPKKFSLKNLKSEHYFIIFVYLIVFAIIGYFVVGNLFPEQIPKINTGGYELTANTIGITNKLRSFYFDKDSVFGEKQTINENSVKPIISGEAFNLIFSPKQIVKENTSAILEMNFFSLGTELYINDKLIIPDLTDYELISDYQKDSVYIRKDLDYNKGTFIQGRDSTDFVYRNFAGASVYSFKDESSEIPILTDYNKDTTRIKTTFRDNLKLAVYAEGKLEIDFTKQDLNSYVGKDEYNVTIKDYDGEIVFSKIYKDEGDKKDSKKKGEEQDFEIKLTSLPRGIYYISFVKDKNNKAADSTVKDIRINSNKVLIIDRSLPWSGFDFYTKVIFEKKVGFNYWWTSKEQKIYQKGEVKKTINLDEDWKSKKYETNLTKKGDYTFEIDVGYLWVYADAISIDKKTWFDLPNKFDKKLIDTDFIIIDKEKLIINQNNIYIKEDLILNKEDKIKLQVLDENKLYFKSLKLILRN